MKNLLLLLLLLFTNNALAGWSCGTDCVEATRVCKKIFGKKICTPPEPTAYAVCMTFKSKCSAITAIKKPYYGNFCGMGNINAAPIDALDRACAAHDSCYASIIPHSCACDANLVKDANAALSSLSVAGKESATLLILTFSNAVANGLCF